MLNPFPQLLTFGFFAPMVIRMAVSCFLLVIAWRVVNGAKTLAATPFPLVGKTNSTLIAIAGGFTALVGLALLFGYGTQWAAILSILISLKLVWFQKRLEPVILFPNSTHILLILLSASLLLTGAGALAFDLPL